MADIFLVVCVNNNMEVCSVDLFDDIESADAFLAEDARQTYDEIHEHDQSDIDVSPGYAEVVDGERIWRWSIFPVNM